MKSILVACMFFFSFSVVCAADSTDLKPGMHIRSSVTIQRNNYFLNAPADMATPLVVIEGSNITIDFNQSVLSGSTDKPNPDEFYGLAILVKKGSKNIVLRNLSIHGYKVAIMAEDVTNLTIDNCDLSYNWRQRLLSTRKKENEEDWMSFHHNENNEWLRYGAGIYLKNCKKAIIRNNTITGGQCALMMTSCSQADVHDNNFSFNSGIGIGLYRSTDNRVYYNRLDYNVRGYSFGKYKRGQDSAGILVFEQSSDNIFAFNTATHSGDGFFLWAGQSTMDSGKGGCNDNFVYGNDFSYAPTNGIEVTFSRNLLMKNIIKSCDHGVWGGYSFDSDITDNHFENNRIAIAIEHGQNINIALNQFDGDTTGIKLWSRAKQPEDWAYPKLRNADSRNYWIAANRFANNSTVYDLMGTDTIVLSGNTKLDIQQNLKTGERLYNIDSSRENDPFDIEYQKDPRLAGIKADHLPVTKVPQGKEQIRMTEWGPYNYAYPLLWLKNNDSAGLYRFDVLGPTGNWEVASLKGYELVEKGASGFPSYLVLKKNTTQTEQQVQLRYSGAPFADLMGRLQKDSVYFFEYRN